MSQLTEQNSKFKTEIQLALPVEMFSKQNILHLYKYMGQNLNLFPNNTLISEGSCRPSKVQRLKCSHLDEEHPFSVQNTEKKRIKKL